MMHFLRGQSTVVLSIVLAMIGLGFLFYGSSGELLAPGPGGDFGRIAGHDISLARYSEVKRNTLLTSGREADSSQIGLETWANLLSLEKASALHIEISDDELADSIKNSKLFQDPKTGVYSPEIRRQRLAELEANLHIGSGQFLAALRQSLTIQAVHAALFATVQVPRGTIELAFEKYYGPAEIAVARLAVAPYLEKTQVTPAEIEVEYKNNQQNLAYRTAEERRVDYVLLPFPVATSKQSDKEKAAAKNALGQRLQEFRAALQPDPAPPGAAPILPDFASVAKKLGLTATTTGFFTADSPPAPLPPSPAFNNAAFALAPQDPTGKVVELGNGLAVLHLAEIKPSLLRPLPEIPELITRQLTASRGHQAAATAAAAAAKSLKAAVAAGTDFKSAAAALKLPVESFPPFVPADQAQKQTATRTRAYVAATLRPGQVSEPVPQEGEQTFEILYLAGRAKADPAGLAAFEQNFAGRQREQLRQVVFNDWVNWASKQPGVRRPADLAVLDSNL